MINSSDDEPQNFEDWILFGLKQLKNTSEILNDDHCRVHFRLHYSYLSDYQLSVAVWKIVTPTLTVKVVPKSPQVTINYMTKQVHLICLTMHCTVGYMSIFLPILVFLLPSTHWTHQFSIFG